MKIRPTTVIDSNLARPEDLPLVMEILAEAAAWLKQKGIDQDYVASLYEKEINLNP